MHSKDVIVSLPKPGRKARGLTLIETVLACIMLSLIIISVLGLLGSLLVASTKSSDSTAATFVANYLLDSARNDGPPHPDGGEKTGVREMRTHELDIPMQYQYRLTWTKVGEPHTFVHHTTHETRAGVFSTTLYHVKVEVWWMVDDPDAGRAEGGGRRSLVQERLIQVGRR